MTHPTYSTSYGISVLANIGLRLTLELAVIIGFRSRRFGMSILKYCVCPFCCCNWDSICRFTNFFACCKLFSSSASLNFWICCNDAGGNEVSPCMCILAPIFGVMCGWVCVTCNSGKNVSMNGGCVYCISVGAYCSGCVM